MTPDDYLTLNRVLRGERVTLSVPERARIAARVLHCFDPLKLARLPDEELCWVVYRSIQAFAMKLAPSSPYMVGLRAIVEDMNWSAAPGNQPSTWAELERLLGKNVVSTIKGLDK